MLRLFAEQIVAAQRNRQTKELSHRLDESIHNAEEVSAKVKVAFQEFSDWRNSESLLRELRQKVTFALLAEAEDIEQVTTIVDSLFSLLERAGRI